MSTFEGFAELQRSFSALKSDVQTKVARSAVNAAAQVVKTSAIGLAKSQLASRSGALLRNIAVKRETTTAGLTQYNVGVRHGRGTKGRLAKITKQRGKYKKQYLNDPFYFRFHEFGFLNARSGKRVQARPFLSPALKNNQTRAVEKMIEILNRRIARANRGA